MTHPAPRPPPPDPDALSPAQAAMVAAISAGPRPSTQHKIGPFPAWLHAPEFGIIAQEIGAHVRYAMSVPERVREFTILCTAVRWQAQVEWFAHAPIAEAAGVSTQTLADLRAGRRPESAPEDERAIYDLVRELYDTRRVSDATFAKAKACFGEAGTIELVGVAGYYALVSMTLNTFRSLPPEGQLPFPEPESR